MDNGGPFLKHTNYIIYNDEIYLVYMLCKIYYSILVRNFIWMFCTQYFQTKLIIVGQCVFSISFCWGFSSGLLNFLIFQLSSTAHNFYQIYWSVLIIWAGFIWSLLTLIKLNFLNFLLSQFQSSIFPIKL